MPQISVILPVYQAERWLRRCLDCIVSQTFQNWECILVDDSGKDRSSGPGREVLPCVCEDIRI